MKQFVLLWCVFCILVVCANTVSLAATLEGNAYKQGASDHSGITLNLESLPGVPAVGFAGLALLLLAATLFLFRGKTRYTAMAVIILTGLGVSCISYALVQYTTTTDNLGAYSFTDVEPGEYRLEASAPGYYPEERVPLTILEGFHLLTSITLQPITTPTPTPIPECHTLDMLDTRNYGNEVRSVCWSPDGTYLAVGGFQPDSGDEIQVFELNGSSLSLVDSLNYGSAVFSVDWSPDGNLSCCGRNRAWSRFRR